VLEARGLSVVFGAQQVLREVSFSVAEHEFVCIVGPSGCGKTTLLRTLAGLTPVSSGQALFRGGEVRGPQAALAVVFQDYGRALLPWRTVAGNVALALEARGIPASEHAARIAPLLAKLGLSEHADKFPAQLSGGMQQRLQIARSLAQEPQVLLMDEPFGSLDAITRQELQDEVARLAKDERRTVVFVTHDLEEAIYLGDRVIALASNPGRVAEIVDIELPRPRQQLATREDPRFLQYRHRLYKHLGH
jgi:ABC-type nitrate/sulfonate/bicarbonate transport system ATPase subunit